MPSARRAMQRCCALPIGAFIAMFVVRSSLAQQPAPPALASIVGVVDDSVRRGPLANAIVVLLGTNRTVVTNARGGFLLDSIPPGPHRLGVRHPLLDTLGLSILSETFQVTAGQRLEMGVSTPSLESVRARACPRGGVVSGPAMLFGRVLDAESDAPLAGASLSLAYKGSDAADTRERVRQARARDDGSFAICGLPENITGTVQATHGAQTTPEMPVTFGDDLATAILTLSSSTERAAALTGRVTNRAGEAVAEAQVAVTGTTTVVTTGADGTFSLNGLPSGTREVVIRKIGFAPSTRIVALTKREPRRVAVVLNSAQVLTAVRVEAKFDPALFRAGFMDRKKAAAGHFITPEEVERRKPDVFSDLLQGVSGFQVTTTATGRFISSTRGAGMSGGSCVNVFIDRSPFDLMQPGDLDQALRPGDIGAVEAYPSSTNVPAEFQRSSRPCATIAVWTKTYLGRP